MNGFLNINKSPGITSYDVIRVLKKFLPRKVKIGHTGTLDPMATGVLPIAIGQATRIIPYIENDIKTYRAAMTLGGTSTTQDAWGEIAWGNASIAPERLNEVIFSFLGDIEQIPPMYSAVHHQGKRLYHLAREGIEVERKPRQAHIYSIKILNVERQHDYPVVELEVTCSRGTYIRTLCHDIGKALGSGAFLSALTRTQAGAFSISDAVNMEKIIEKHGDLSYFLYQLDYPLVDMPAIKLESMSFTKKMLNGQAIPIESSLPPGTKVRVYNLEGRIIAIAHINHDTSKKYLKPERVLYKAISEGQINEDRSGD